MSVSAMASCSIGNLLCKCICAKRVLHEGKKYASTHSCVVDRGMEDTCYFREVSCNESISKHIETRFPISECLTSELTSIETLQLAGEWTLLPTFQSGRTELGNDKLNFRCNFHTDWKSCTVCLVSVRRALEIVESSRYKYRSRMHERSAAAI